MDCTKTLEAQLKLIFPFAAAAAAVRQRQRQREERKSDEGAIKECGAMKGKHWRKVILLQQNQQSEGEN